MLETRKHPCFLCGRELDDAFVLWDKTTRKQEEIKSTVIQYRDQKMIHGKTVLCKCGLAQEFEPMTEESLNRFYTVGDTGESPYRTFYPIPKGDIPRHIKNSIEYLFNSTVIQNRLLTPYKILIVGSGDTESVHIIKDAFPLARVYTFEPGLPKSDINFREKPDEQFDFIFCNNVLEHVHNPVTFLESLKSLFHPLTSMVLSVPDLLTTSVHMGKDRWFSNAHIYHFSFDSLWQVVCKAGLGVTVNIKFITEEMGDKIYFNIRLQDPLKPVDWKIIEVPDYLMSYTKVYINTQDELFNMKTRMVEDYGKIRKSKESRTTD